MDNLEARIRLIEIKIEKIEREQVAQNMCLNQNTEQDKITRQLVLEVKNIKAGSQKSKRRQVQGTGVALLAIALFVVDQIEASQFIDSLIAIGSVAGWWISTELKSSN